MKCQMYSDNYGRNAEAIQYRNDGAFNNSSSQKLNTRLCSDYQSALTLIYLCAQTINNKIDRAFIDMTARTDINRSVIRFLPFS